MTVALRFPLAYFPQTSIPVEELAKNFYVDKLLAKIKINYDGSLDIIEKYSVILLSPQSSFIRDFYTLQTNDSSLVKDHIIKDVKVNYLSSEIKDAHFIAQEDGLNKYINLYSNTGSFSDKLEVTYGYKVWGAVTLKTAKPK